MAETSGPFDTGGFTETNWFDLARGWAGDGVIYQANFNELKVTAGALLNVSVAAGIAVGAGGFLYKNSTAKTISVGTPAPPTIGGQTRLDLICIRIDFTANTATAVQKAGTASSSPVLPTPQRDSSIWEIPLAQVLIPTNATSVGTITDLRSFAQVPAHKSFVQCQKQTPQTFVNNVAQKLSWTFASASRGNSTDFFDDANDRFIAPVNGLYSVSYNFQATAGTGQTGSDAELLKNGARLQINGAAGPGGTWYHGQSVPKHFLLAGEYYEAQVNAHGNSTSMVTVGGDMHFSYDGPAYLL